MRLFQVTSNQPACPQGVRMLWLSPAAAGHLILPADARQPLNAAQGGAHHAGIDDLNNTWGYCKASPCCLQVVRMLRLSPAETAHQEAFRQLHPEAAAAGFDRIFRSPTLWEDLVKSMLLCNCG